MDWPYLLLRAEGELGVILRVEKAARDAGGVSETDQLTSLLASAAALQVAPEPLEATKGRGGRVGDLLTEVQAVGVPVNGQTLDCIESALRERLAREDEDVRAANAWARAERRLPRGNAAADAWLADAILAASLEHPETLEPQNADEFAVFESWEGDEDAHQEALDEWRSWTLAGPSGLATVGRNQRKTGYSGTHLGLRFDRRVPVDAFVAPTAESCPHRPSGAPTVLQPASALAGPESLHGLVDGIVLGERVNEGKTSDV